MNIQLLNKDMAKNSADITEEFLNEKKLKAHKTYKTLNLAGFSASQDSVCFLHEKALLACGIENNESESIRSTTSVAIKSLKSANYKSAAFSVNEKNIQAVVEGIILGGYEFNNYKSEPKKSKLKNIFLLCTNIKKMSKTF